MKMKGLDAKGLVDPHYGVRPSAFRAVGSLRLMANVRLRGRGYASALVAGLSRKLLSEGRQFCFLYTDLANPTSNSIYQRIGYVAVCDAAHHTFESRGSL